MQKKQKIRESKKGVFLIIGLVHLNIYLLVAAIWPTIPIALFVNSLIIILSLYLTGQSAIDTVQNFNNSNETKTDIKTETRNENINEHIVYEETAGGHRPYAQKAANEDNNE